ncbi:hypothetical protein MTO96_022305 [Rhipicephalus appendiculatus]
MYPYSQSMGDYESSPSIIGPGLPQVGHSPSHNARQPYDGKFSHTMPEAAAPNTRQDLEPAVYFANSSGSRKRTHEETVSSAVTVPPVDSPEQVPRKQLCNSSPASQRLVWEHGKVRPPLLNVRHDADELDSEDYQENGNCDMTAQPRYAMSDILNGNSQRILMRLGEDSTGIALRLAEAGHPLGGPLLHLDSRSSWSNDGSSDADEEGAPLMDNHGGHEGDDTSISSRASSRLLSIDSLSVTYDSEYDNYGVGFNGAMGRTEDLRSLTDCIARNFGHCVSDNEDSDVLA